MEPKLTRGEYWLLNNVVDTLCPLRLLFGDSVEEMFNNPGHRLDRQRLVATLAEMSKFGWIEGYRMDDGFPLTAEMIEAGLQEPPSLDATLGYRLTPLGGSVWEAFAAPDWDRYINAWTSAEGEESEYYCTTRWRLEKYLSLLEQDEILVVPETVAWDEVSPWQATYWKQRPHAHRVRFYHRDRNNHEPSDVWLKSAGVQSLKKWYDWE